MDSRKVNTWPFASALAFKGSVKASTSFCRRVALNLVTATCRNWTCKKMEKCDKNYESAIYIRIISILVLITVIMMWIAIFAPTARTLSWKQGEIKRTLSTPSLQKPFPETFLRPSPHKERSREPETLDGTFTAALKLSGTLPQTQPTPSTSGTFPELHSSLSKNIKKPTLRRHSGLPQPILTPGKKKHRTIIEPINLTVYAPWLWGRELLPNSMSPAPSDSNLSRWAAGTS